MDARASPILVATPIHASSNNYACWFQHFTRAGSSNMTHTGSTILECWFQQWRHTCSPSSGTMADRYKRGERARHELGLWGFDGRFQERVEAKKEADDLRETCTKEDERKTSGRHASERCDKARDARSQQLSTLRVRRPAERSAGRPAGRKQSFSQLFPAENLTGISRMG